MANDVSIKFGVQGEQTFKTALQAINTQVKALDAEFNTAIKQMDNADDREQALAKATDALTRKQEAQTKQIDALNKKRETEEKTLAKIGNELEEAKKKYGENAEEVKKLEVAYNRQATTVSKATIELEKANEKLEDTKNQQKKLADSTENVADNFDEAGEKASVFGDVLSAQVVSEAIINGIKKIAEGLKEIATASAEYADDILTLSSTTGLATDTIQEFKYMADLVDVDFNTISGALTKLTRNMQSAKNGTKAQKEAFDKLGISVVGVDGALRDNEEVFYEVLTALGAMTNETEADAVAMDIFGKSAKELNPLIDAGTEKMKELAEEAHNVGYVMSEEALQSNGAYQDSLDRIKAQTEALKNAFGTALAPALEKIAGVVSKVVIAMTEFIQTHEWTMPVIIGVVTALGALATALGISALINTVSKAFSALNVVMNANYIMLVISLIAGLVTAFITAYETSDTFREKINNAFSKVKEAITSAIEKVKNAVNTLKELPRMALNWGKDLIDNFVNGIKATIGKVKDAVKNVANTVKDFLGFSEPKKGALSNFHTYAPDMMKLFAKGMTDNIGIIQNASNRVAKSVNIGQGSIDAISGTLTNSMPNSITVQSVLDGRIIGENSYNYINQRKLMFAK